MGLAWTAQSLSQCLECWVTCICHHNHFQPATPHMFTSVPGNLCYSERSSNQKWVKQLPRGQHLGKPSFSTAHHSTSSWKHTARGSDDKERTACKARETECDHRCVEPSSSASYLKHPHTVGRCSNPLTIAEVG